jgi:RHS repeat-associated protein
MYLPFGGTRWESGTTPTDFRFTGQRKEAGFGLYDYNVRYYAPTIGRFVSADAVVPGAGNSQALNRYAYTFNNPLKYVDPSGHCPKPPGGGNIICVAGFIPTNTTVGIPGVVYFQGDNRDFSNNSKPGASRFWLWIDANTGNILDKKVHPTQRVTGPNGDPVGEPFPPRDTPDSNPLTELFYGSNQFTVTRAEDGTITLKYAVVCSDPICNRLLAPNGSITFKPNEFGTFDTFSYADAFPNLEAYHWQDGNLNNSYLFRIQNFSAAERQAGHSEMGTSLGMSWSMIYSVIFDSSDSRTLTYYIMADQQIIQLSEPH